MTASGDRFDYVIVGAGSAGAVLASRLSEDPRSTVCLIEAGPKDTHPFIAMPLGLIWLAKNTRHNWLYASAPQHGLGGRSVSIPRGRVLGGSSAINGMIYIRGQREDYDRWAEAGCTGWDYESVLPYFIKSENNRAPDLNGVHHGKSGPLSVTDLADPNPMDTVFIEAAGQLQFRPNRDFNGAGQEGVGIYQVTQEGGRRHSTAHAFLEPARGRANLRVVTSSQVAALEWSNDRVAGVRVRDGDGNERAIGADREVILSAGAIGSPEILMRSGIGPGADLTAAGIAVKHDLPGVGANLHDHVDCLVICKSRSRTPYGLSAGAAPKLFYEGLRYLAARRGMLASNMVEAGGFVRSQPDVERPDIQFHFIPGRKSHRGRMLEYGHGVSLHTGVLRPKSRGAVTLNAADPSARPVIDLGLLREEDDMQLLMRGVKIARDILRQQPFAPHGLSEILPGDGVTNDAELTAFIREHARSVYHPVGTCAMGTGPRAVVDPRLKVRGVEGLRIVDASIMPEIVSGNTNAPTIMIAEKAADMIRQDAATRH